VLSDGSELAAQLLARLGSDRRAGISPVAAVAGRGYARVSERAYIVDAARDADYDELLTAVGGTAGPVHVVDLWSLAEEEDGGVEELRRLAAALARRGGTSSVDVVTAGAVEPAGAGVEVARAAIVGMCREIGAERGCRSIDLPRAAGPRPSAEARKLAERLAGEILAPRAGGCVALREKKRWVETW